MRSKYPTGLNANVNFPSKAILSRLFAALKIVWKCFVCPGVRETLTTFFPISALSSDDLPTFGNPTQPTVKIPSFMISMQARLWKELSRLYLTITNKIPTLRRKN
uniref:CSON010205 protein n=1 Tax=Culicoides sonorensis TaxID=179676 RepID=A0A336N0R4_CULSO